MKKTASPLKQMWVILKFSCKFFWETDKSTFIWVILSNAVPSLIIIPNLLLDKSFIDSLVKGIGHPINQTLVNTIIFIVIARFFLSSFRSISNRTSGYLARKFFWRNNQRLEVVIGEKYATISVPTLESSSFKDRYLKIEREGISRVNRIGENIVRIPQHLIGIISSLAIFSLTEPLVILFSFISLIPNILVDRWFIKKDYENDTAVGLLHRKRGMYSYYLGRARSYLELRILNIFEYLGQKINSLWDEIIIKRLKLQSKRRIYLTFAGIFDNGVSYSFDALFAIQAMLGKITIGTAQAYIRAISSFKQSVTDLTAAILEMYEHYLYIEDLVWFLNLENPYYNNSGVKLENTIAHIRFDHVWFKYPHSDQWILKDISFEIHPKENIAIVGKNGAGKTTIVKLLCGFYEPDKGKIFVNDISVKNINKPIYWRKIATLFQDSDTFGLTAREAISVSNTSKMHDFTQIKTAAKVAQLDDWLESLPLKYDTPMIKDFENGVSPSSGQWQKLIIARTLFKDPEVLILDEPTSNVDPEAEEKIFQEILKIGRDKIIIFISHRFSTVRKADNILVLNKGGVEEIGTHENLMKNSGLYSHLFTLQAKNYQ